MSNKILVTKPGYNALTDTNPNHFNFSSDYNTFKYSTSGTITLAYTTGSTLGIRTYTTTVAFNFNYRPVILVYVDQDGSGVYLPAPYHSQVLSRMLDIHHYWDQSTLSFQITVGEGFSGPAVNKTATFKYFIFKNDTGL